MKLRHAIAVLLVLWTAGCTLNVNVFPGVKTDIRWPATQPAPTLIDGVLHAF